MKDEYSASAKRHDAPAGTPLPAGVQAPPAKAAGADGVHRVLTELHRRFRRMALRFLGDEDDAADVLQDAFLRLWPRRAEMGGEGDAAALAGTTVRHLCIDTLRRRERTVSLPDGAEPPAGDPEADDAVAQRFRAVERAVDACLTPLQQTILRRRDYHGESYADIAASLGMQEAAVRMQLSRARAAVRSQWRRYAGSD